MPSIENALMTAEKLRHRAFGALRDLMIAISRETPVVIFVDDLQWGDADSVVAFERMFAEPDPPALLFVGSYRSDEQDSSPFLRAWRSVDRDRSETSVEVGPLTPSQARELVGKALPEENDITDEEIDRIYEESDGNPYFLAQLIESYDRETKRFRPVPLHDLIESRLSRLPNESRPLLEMLAVAGHDLPVSQIGTLLGSNRDPYSTLTRMRNEKLVRLWGSGEGPVSYTHLTLPTIQL